MKKNAIILLNLGGPDSLEAIEPFLFNLFSDQDIFKIPFGQKIFAKIISKLRTSKVKQKYMQIGGKSPINHWTQLQQAMLKKQLQPEYDSPEDDTIEVYYAMRYWNPLISKIAEEVASQNFDKIILLPLFPQYSITTTGSAFNEWARVYKGDPDKVIYIKNYCEDERYILALNERIDETLAEFPEEIQDNVQFVFSAHGTPLSLVEQGDPYQFQIESSVAKVMNLRDYSHNYHLCYQSKVGPVKWLKPLFPEKINRLAKTENTHLLIIPISFVSDHIETLHELDLEYRKMADLAGIKTYKVMQGLNDSETFIDALKNLAITAITDHENHEEHEKK